MILFMKNSRTTKKQKYVGLSLAFCVRDILMGKILIEDVRCIYAGFKWKGQPAPHYYDVHWCEWNKEEVDSVLSKLDIRPRPLEDGHNIAYGCWFMVSNNATEEECIRRVIDPEDRIAPNDF